MKAAGHKTYSLASLTPPKGSVPSASLAWAEQVATATISTMHLEGEMRVSS